MVIVIYRYGQYSNRLFQDMRIRTFCRKHKIRCWNLDMSDMEKYFEIPKTPLPLILLGTIIRAILKVMRIFRFDPVLHSGVVYNEECVEKAKRFGVHLVDGWGIYDSGEEKNSLDIIRKRYHLKPQYYMNNPLYLQMQKWKQLGGMLVGIHIRRRDYREWCNGIYYYEDAVYERWISQIRSLYKDKTLKFIIFSDEPCGISADDIVISHESWYVDQFLLGMTDICFGPPSTFRGWAVFIYGNKTCDMANKEMDIRDRKQFIPPMP